MIAFEKPLLSEELDNEARRELAQTLLNLFDKWSLSTPEQMAALGIAPKNRATLSRYKSGEAIGSSRDQLDRVGNLLAIHKNLRLLFPRNPELLYGWIKAPNRAFEQKTPIQVIAENGFMGLLMVRGYLDRMRGT
jgi:uncharacterized protein (DUF2384 family)